MSSVDESVRSRILRAAKSELALHGTAGARIARIAARAETSKERIYAYFRTKTALFEEVYLTRFAVLAQISSIGEGGPPEFVGKLFDHYAANPDDLRLARWNEIENAAGPSRLSDARARMYARVVDDIAQAQARGEVDRVWSAFDLFVMLVNLALAWPTAPDVVRQLAESVAGPLDLATQRRLAVEAARRLCEPGE